MAKNEELLRTIMGFKKGNRVKVNEDALKKIDEIKLIYTELSGTQSYLPLRISNFQIKIDAKKYVELDDHLHFNQYRLMTLKSKVYNNTKFFDLNKYKQMCEEHEIDCLKAGGCKNQWKTNNSEKLFSKSGPEKDLSKNGSSKWKQKAYFDFLKDVYAKENEITLRRISVWEKIKDEITIKQILEEELTEHYDELKKFVFAKFSEEA